MQIALSKVPVDGGLYEEDVPAAVLELAGDAQIRPEGPISCRFTVQKVSGELVVSGRLSMPVTLQCGRCGCFFSTTVADSSFLRAYDAPEGTETVDLTPDIREDILLNLPAYPLCSPECKGLCTQCGHNLNEGPCGCKPPAVGPDKWSALDGLKGL
ncbi:MAG: DUF177 domain-containing protein [Kiritimatiellae bacterium]|nr:DUF177 domain-containing protein [Kiritimatiellia bacterium]